MKTLLLNLPNKDTSEYKTDKKETTKYKTDKIMRRYMCSYNAPNFLFPPQELISLGGIIIEWKKENPGLIDAIAEELDLKTTIKKIKEFNPDVLVTIAGFECFEDDMFAIKEIKKSIPKLKIICFGHYPTIFAKEILSKTEIDIILLGEPDITFSELYDKLNRKKSYKRLRGIVYKTKGKIIINKLRDRIKNLDELPFPAYSLLKRELYNEPFLRKPFTTLQTTRGCPFMCNYCVKTYGREVAVQSAESIFKYIKRLISEHEITNFRFMDDTFIIDKERIIKLCKLIIDNKLKIKWTALSRVDVLDQDVLWYMKKAGCKRLYIGIESGSQRILDYYHKGYKVTDIKKKIDLIKKSRIEAIGFFMVGAPKETIVDLEKSINLAKKLNLDYAIISKLIVYPGTPLYEKLKDKIDFSLFPYKNEFKNGLKNEEYKKWEKKFYEEFYLRRPSYMTKKLLTFFFKPRESLNNIKILLRFILTEKGKKNREDFF